MAIAATRCWETQAEQLCATNMAAPFGLAWRPTILRPAGTGKDWQGRARQAKRGPTVMSHAAQAAGSATRLGGLLARCAVQPSVPWGPPPLQLFDELIAFEV
jgi:hypothetical protein